jgi:predicted P-loop ATPase
VNHAVLVFVGEQGIYKSTWMEHLMPPELANYYIVRTNSKNINKDDMIAVAANGLICNEELDAMRPADLDQFKALVTQTDIVERAPYARKPERRPHLASFCATGNKTKFLNDPSGNRRWLPFEVLEILSPREFPFDHEGIYSQAWALVKSGFRYWFSAEEIAEVNEHNKGYEEESLEMELIFQYFRKPGPDETGEFMTAAGIMQYIGGNIVSKLNKITLGRMLKAAGFEHKRNKNVSGFIVVPLSSDEIQAQKKRLAVEV